MDPLAIIDTTNFYMILLVIFPLLLNLKYYVQLKFEDYLYVSLYFFFYFLSYQYWLWDMIAGSIIGGSQIGASFYYIGLFWLIRIAIRTKWVHPPIWAQGISYSFIIFAGFNQLAVFYSPVGNHHLGQYFFNPLSVLGYLLVVYCFASTSLATSDRNAKISRYLWIIYSSLSVFQNLFFFSLVVLPDIAYNDIILLNILILQINGLVTQLTILTLHLAFPEAVLFSHEQLFRAKRLYDNIQKSGNLLEDLGIDRIKNYLKNIPEEIMVEAHIQN